MVNKIAYTNNDEKVEIISFDLRKNPQFYVDLIIQRGYSDAIVVDTDNLPNNDYYDAWEISGNRVVVNLTKAKQVKKEKLLIKKEKNKKELEKLYTEAKTKNRDTTSIESRIDYLESLPKDTDIDNATTIEEIEIIDFDSWSNPVIDNLGEDKSKIPVMFHNESESESSTTNEEYIQKLRLTFTTKPTTYFIWYYAEVYTSSKRKRVSTRVEIDDTTTIHESTVIPSSQELGWSAISGEYVNTFTEGTHTIDFDYKSEGSSVTIRRCRIYTTEIVSG